MLGKPNCGWTFIACGTVVIGSASYIDDVPILCLDAFLHYFREGGSRFSLCLDAEGYDIGIIEFGESLYKVSTDTQDGLNSKYIDGTAFGLSAYASNDEILRTLAKELVQDISEYLDVWVTWMDDDLDDRKKEERKRLLMSKTSELEVLLHRHSSM